MDKEQKAEAIDQIARENPIEMLATYDVHPGEFAMFIGYAGRDEFNIDAQVESFLYYAKFKGLGVAVAYEPDGHHDAATAMKFMPALVRWLGPQLEPYAPPVRAAISDSWNARVTASAAHLRLTGASSEEVLASPIACPKKSGPEGPLRSDRYLTAYPRGSPFSLTVMVGPGGALNCARCSIPRKL